MTTAIEGPFNRETLRGIILAGGMAFPTAPEAARWPVVARAALVAIWTVMDAAPPLLALETAAIVPSDGAPPEWLDRLSQAPPLALVLLAHMELLEALVPATREDPDALAAERAGWEALQGFAPLSSLASLDSWPVETRAVDGGMLVCPLPERLPPVREARAWLDKLHAVVKRNEKKIRHAYANRRSGGGLLRLPRSGLDGIADFRKARCQTIPFAPGVIRVVPETPQAMRLQLPLPFPLPLDAESELRSVDAHKILRGGTLRAALAACASWLDAGAPSDGLFRRNDSWILRELLGRTGRNAGNTARDFAKEFESLTSLFVVGVGGWTAPEPWINARDNDGRQYRLAPMLVTEVLESRRFVQVPNAVMRLEPKIELPIALSLATFWHGNIAAALRGPGYVQTELRPLLDALGDDPATRADRGGYYPARADLLRRVASSAGLGVVRVDGEGPTAGVTLEPSAALAAAYSGILDPAPKERARPRKKQAKRGK